jgi:hypothetical protein
LESEEGVGWKGAKPTPIPDDVGRLATYKVRNGVDATKGINDGTSGGEGRGFHEPYIAKSF